VDLELFADIVGELKDEEALKLTRQAVSQIVGDQVHLFDELSRGKSEPCALIARLGGSRESGLYYVSEMIADKNEALQDGQYALASQLQRMAEAVTKVDRKTTVPLVTMSKRGLKLQMISREAGDGRLQGMISELAEV